jgi:hypothetical protein
MTRSSFSELAYQVYQLVLVTLTVVVVLRLLSDYDWSKSALYGISSVASFYLGQGIVGFLQSRRDRKIMQQENDLF